MGDRLKQELVNKNETIYSIGGDLRVPSCTLLHP